MSRTTASLFVALAVLILLAGSFLLGWQLARRGAEAPPPTDVAAPPEDIFEEEPLPDQLVVEPAEFSELPGWEDDRLADALPALDASCRVWRNRAGDAPVGPDALGGTVAQWLPVCDRLRDVAAGDSEALRQLFEETLRPWAATNRGEPQGLFTGYYEPTLQGSRRRGGRYQIPLHRRPGDLVEVDLGSFRQDLAGRRIAGRLAGGRLEPYADRTDIEEGALSGRGLELAWVDSAVDAFFLQIQGSGRVEMDDGSVLRVGYAGQNGHPYYAIGKELVERGAMEVDEVSMQSIRQWLETHPEEGEEVMRTNASYVFFRALEGPGPLGSMGVALTPGRSLAVDRTFLPMGTPVWLAAEAPVSVLAEEDTAAPVAAPGPDGEVPATAPLERLIVAQDTGGAIRGPVRGDVFWGPGEAAADVAGRMRHPGRLWLLLPRGVEPAAAGG